MKEKHFIESYDTTDLARYIMINRFNLDLYNEFKSKLKRNSWRKCVKILNNKFTLQESGISKLNKLFIYREGLVVNISLDNYDKTDYVRFFYKNGINSVSLYDSVKQFKKTKEQDNVYIISQRGSDLRLTGFDIKNQNTNIQINYNDQTIIDYKKLKIELLKEESESLVLIYSSPGCGKTSLIRKLIQEVEDKEFVFLPNNLIDMFINPAFMNFAISELKNKILIVEDAENILTSRKSSNNPYVSTILNLTDGLMKDLLNIKIICTINNNINTIDEALLRKGRLLMKTELNSLSVEKSNNLLKKLGHSFETTVPMKLCDIYNYQKDDYREDKKSIGFKK